MAVRWLTTQHGGRLPSECKARFLACSMKGDTGGQYYEAEKWAGKVFPGGLEEIGCRKRAPGDRRRVIALWDIPLAGSSTFNFANWKPERVVAFIANKAVTMEIPSRQPPARFPRYGS